MEVGSELAQRLADQGGGSGLRPQHQGGRSSLLDNSSRLCHSVIQYIGGWFTARQAAHQKKQQEQLFAGGPHAHSPAFTIITPRYMACPQ